MLIGTATSSDTPYVFFSCTDDVIHNGLAFSSDACLAVKFRIRLTSLPTRIAVDVTVLLR